MLQHSHQAWETSQKREVSSEVMKFIGQTGLGRSLNLFNRDALGQESPSPTEGKTNFCFFQTGPGAVISRNTHGGPWQAGIFHLGQSSPWTHIPVPQMPAVPPSHPHAMQPALAHLLDTIFNQRQVTLQPHQLPRCGSPDGSTGAAPGWAAAAWGMDVMDRLLGSTPNLHGARGPQPQQCLFPNMPTSLHNTKERHVKSSESQWLTIFTVNSLFCSISKGPGLPAAFETSCVLLGHRTLGAQTKYLWPTLVSSCGQDGAPREKYKGTETSPGCSRCQQLLVSLLSPRSILWHDVTQLNDVEPEEGLCFKHQLHWMLPRFLHRTDNANF